jgi:hypothetical protein
MWLQEEANGGPWELEFFQDKNGREPCRDWIHKLSREKRLAMETALEHVLAVRGLDIVETEFGKALGKGLYEFRLRWTANEVAEKVGVTLADAPAESESILLRVFFCTAGRRIILLLSGYDKGTDGSSRRQDAEIARARKCLTAYREASKRSRTARRRAS